MAETAFDREAKQIRDFLSDLGTFARAGEGKLSMRAGQLLKEFETRLAETHVPAPAITPARLALAVLIDQAARREDGVGMSAWLAAAHANLFDRREVTVDTIRRFRDTAQAEGSDYAELADFLGRIVAEIEGTRRRREALSRKPALFLALGTIGLVLSLGAYAAYLDYRYHAGILASFEEEAAVVTEDPLADRLGRLAELSSQVSRAAASSPLAELASDPFWSSAAKAEAAYRAEAADRLPGAIRDAIEEALATEGNDIDQYDSLRAWSVLSGRSDWSPAYLEGWLATRDQALGTGPLADHVAALDGPEPGLGPPDHELLAQAVGFAAEAREEDRAFLELTRLDDIRTLPAWDATDTVPGLDEVVVRRSGRPLSEEPPRVFTAAGWDFAEDVGIGVAVQKTRAEAARLFSTAVPTRNDAPDRVLERLQAETLRYWKTWLADLRVRPFSDQERAIRVSGALSQRNSPLAGLIREIWTQVGGHDRRRPHELQLRIASEFGPAIQYVEQGKVQELSSLFAALNVALGTIEFNEEQGAEKLMNVQDLARSISALKAAPPLVAQIAEDVLVQTSAAHSSLLANPLTREWQQNVYPLCSQVVDGRYPFREGDDASVAAFVDLFGPSGALRRFVTGNADRYLDTSGAVWRWKPEARLAGVGQDSARFLQDAMVVSGGFFGADGALGRAFSVAALAERGEATIVIGGDGGPVRATGAEKRLAWPGPDPDLGAEVAFRRGGDTARVTEPGLWGFLRLLDDTRIRQRDGGRRHLVDLRTSGGRLFFEIAFEDALNPMSAHRLAKGMSCPPVL